MALSGPHAVLEPIGEILGPNDTAAWIDARDKVAIFDNGLGVLVHELGLV